MAQGGVVLPDATDASLTLTNVQAFDDGGYDVVVSSTYGCTTSAVATLNVNLATLDPGLHPFNSGNVNALAVQPDGKLLVGGSWLQTPGNLGLSRNLVRLNTDGSVDEAFAPAMGGMSAVHALAVQPDGKILVGGWFSTVNGESRQNIARLNADGTLDAGFAPDTDGAVCALALQPDGAIVVGGYFGTLGGAAALCVGRLSANGMLDTGFVASADNEVETLAVQADGRIIVGGAFGTLDGESRACLGRLNADGSLDEAFDPGATSAGYCYVSALALQGDGAILVAGSFDTLGGAPRGYLGRLDTNGVVDAGFDPEPDGGVNSLAVQADGAILAGGWFSVIGGALRGGMARLQADGTPDAAFLPSVKGNVMALAEQADGSVAVGGSFWVINGVSQSALGRLANPDAPVESLSFGSGAITWMRGGGAPEVWRTTFENTTNGGASWTLLGTGVRISGGWKLDGVSGPLGTVRARGYTVGGQYDGSGGIVENGLGAPLVEGAPSSRTNLAGTAATFGVWVVGGAPFSFQWRKDGVNLSNGGGVAGATAGTLVLTGVLRGDEGAYDVVISNADGCATSAVATLTVLDPVIAVQPVSASVTLGKSGELSVSARGTGLTYQWRKEGATVPGATGAVLHVASIQAADIGYYDVVVLGTYGCLTSTVAAFEANLVTADTGFHPNADYLVEAIALQPDGGIVIGGGFANVGSQPRSCLARLRANGSLDADFAPAADSWVYALAVQPDGGILVGGDFSTLAGGSRACIGRLLADGELDDLFSPNANGHVGALLVQPDGGILAGGAFSMIASASRTNLARLHADGTIDDTFEADTDGQVCVLAEQADGGVLVGGTFSTLGGSYHANLGRLLADGSVDDTFNPDVEGQVYALAVQPDGRIVLGGYFWYVNGEKRECLARLNPDGSLDMTFNPGANGQVQSLALQADGRIIVGGSFWDVANEAHHFLARLDADGLPDAAFNPDVDSQVEALCVQADGGILVGGWFASLAGESIPWLGRLNNTEPATGALSSDGSTITWLRGGAAPEVWRTTFEWTTNGIDWTMLGDGTRVAGGWTLDGVSLPAGAAVRLSSVTFRSLTSSGGGSGTGTAIRARGYLTCGLWNGSGGIVETTLVVSAGSPAADTDSDGIPDWWTQQYFGHPTGQTGDLSRAADDADGTGQNNLFKYVAGLDPTNPASAFVLDIQSVTGLDGQKKLVFSPRWTDRTYTPEFRVDLLAGAPWTNLVDSTTTDLGVERTVTDLDAADPSRFYRVRIVFP